MGQRLAHITLVVRDYDEAIAFFTQKLDFELVVDAAVEEQNKRWVVVRPSCGGVSLVLGRAKNEQERAVIGDQTGGRVFLFLETDNFQRDYALYQSRGIVFVREPQVHNYGTVAVFEDLYGNLWDLVQFTK